MDNTSAPTAEPKIIPLVEYEQYRKWPTLPSLRDMYFRNRNLTGKHDPQLAKALFRKRGRILVDLAEIDLWIKTSD